MHRTGERSPHRKSFLLSAFSKSSTFGGAELGHLGPASAPVFLARLASAANVSVGVYSPMGSQQYSRILCLSIGYPYILYPKQLPGGCPDLQHGFAQDEFQVRLSTDGGAGRSDAASHFGTGHRSSQSDVAMPGGRSHGNVDVFENLAALDASPPVGRLDQVISRHPSLLASKFVDECQWLSKLFCLDQETRAIDVPCRGHRN